MSASDLRDYDVMLPSLRTALVARIVALTERHPEADPTLAANAAAEGVLALLDALVLDGYSLKRRDGYSLVAKKGRPS